jgi:hypothetical protein
MENPQRPSNPMPPRSNKKYKKFPRCLYKQNINKVRTPPDARIMIIERI